MKKEFKKCGSGDNVCNCNSANECGYSIPTPPHKKPNYIGPGEHSVRELEKMCSQFQQKISELNQQNRAYVEALKELTETYREGLCSVVDPVYLKALSLIQNEGK